MPQHIDPSIIVDATLYILLVFSIITWVLILFKIWQFAKTKQYNRDYSEAFWNANDLQSAEQLTQNFQQGTKVKVAQIGFDWLKQLRDSEHAVRLKFRGSPRDLLEQVLQRQAQHEQNHIESGLTLLASIGSTAPFVGLFGTVLGIMHAMQQISASGSSSLEVVAGPIGDALIATAIGIAVAVPAVLAYNFFIRRAKLHRAALEHFVEGFLHIAFTDKN
ncbi:MAG: MotA/TolQ/ExbB proton channel family protein [Methylococcaceae bacterium]|nr:MotA/TolQ/ExbB proton channel family protein [Methylococcaceae bacterium]